MGNYYVIGDLHGRLDMLQSALRNWSPDTEQLVLLGDYIGHGPNSLETLKEIKRLTEIYGAIPLKGNHEQHLLDFIDEKTLPPNKWKDFAKSETVKSLIGKKNVKSLDLNQIRKNIHTKHSDLLQFLNHLDNYLETRTYIVSHAGIDLYRDDWKNAHPKYMLNSREEMIFGRNQTGKILVFGHTRTSVIRKMFQEDSLDDNVWVSKDGTKIAIDGGNVFGGQLHALHLNDDLSDGLITSVHQTGNRTHQEILFHQEFPLIKEIVPIDSTARTNINKKRNII